ncbi:MAG: polyprenyl synthetase family protein [Nitrospirae bacterium]|nr:polyprenyl synthetase family protein [Nitrospirota bacterium]
MTPHRDIQSYLRARKGLIDAFLSSHFSSPFVSRDLGASMAYSLFAGGKRIRPVLALASYEACGGAPQDIVPLVSALELIHTYSLIHDDLPAMDNDDLRRGKPTNHKVFGEGMAILAGDALLTEAFLLLSSGGNRFSGARGGAVLKVVREIAMAAGAHGMVGGQAADILSEGTAMDGERLSFIHAHKTGALITVSVRMGAILAGAKNRELGALTRYGESIGLAFQIVDDILDVKGDAAEMGKPTGSDERKKKATYPALYGIDASAERAEALIRNAVDSLKAFPPSADPLREIAMFILTRGN